MVLEIDLNDFIGKSEHDCVLRAHPLFDVHDFTDLATCACGDGLLGGVFLEEFVVLFDWGDHGFLAVAFEVGFEVLE